MFARSVQHHVDSSSWARASEWCRDHVSMTHSSVMFFLESVPLELLFLVLLVAISRTKTAANMRACATFERRVRHQARSGCLGSYRTYYGPDRSVDRRHTTASTSQNKGKVTNSRPPVTASHENRQIQWKPGRQKPTHSNTLALAGRS